jgi:hypothetical protein
MKSSESLPAYRRVVFITNEFPPRLGGAGAFAGRICELDGFICVNPEFTNSRLTKSGAWLYKYLWLFELLYRIIRARTLINKTGIVINDFGALIAYSFAQK